MTTDEKLAVSVNRSNPIKFSKITDKEGFLSNFYPSEFKIGPWTYATVENWYQSRKFAGWNPEYEEKVRTAESPIVAKRLGEHERIDGPRLRKWNSIRRGIMMRGILSKFEQNENLTIQLLDTGTREILYWTTQDRYWGVCARGGQNHLGKLLMHVREKLFLKSRKDASDEESSSSGGAEEFESNTNTTLPDPDAAIGDITQDFESDDDGETSS